MTVEEMHYDIKMKINKIDSQSYRNLLIPQLDWVLNEAQEIFIKTIAMPRNINSIFGFEINQRTIDDIRSIVVPDFNIVPVNNIVVLPENYMFYIKSTAIITKGDCKNKEATVIVRQSSDLSEISPFDKPSFEWRTVNIVFNSTGIKIFTDSTFTVDKLSITYIRKPAYIHNAQKFNTGTYLLPGNQLLSGKQDCELPPHTHREIVDIAVLLITNQLQIPDYSIKKDKLNSLNQIN